MNIDDVNQGVEKNKSRRRIGRGPGSGHGKTSGRGHKGAKSRAGYSRKPVFQGGAMPLVRRVPKRGFNNKWAREIAVVNLSDLERLFAAGEEVTPESLKAKSYAKHQYDELKVLGNGRLTKKLRVSAHRFSKTAREQIESAGGEVVELVARISVEEKKKLKKAGAVS